jgi:hypothetical protein
MLPQGGGTSRLDHGSRGTGCQGLGDGADGILRRAPVSSRHRGAAMLQCSGSDTSGPHEVRMCSRPTLLEQGGSSHGQLSTTQPVAWHSIA